MITILHYKINSLTILNIYYNTKIQYSEERKLSYYNILQNNILLPRYDHNTPSQITEIHAIKHIL